MPRTNKLSSNYNGDHEDSWMSKTSAHSRSKKNVIIERNFSRTEKERRVATKVPMRETIRR